jgi:hypothetical protein
MHRVQGPIGPFPHDEDHPCSGIEGPGVTLGSGTEEVDMHAPFEIVWQLSPDSTPVVLRSMTDANEATIAFSEELARLREHAAPGELLMRTGEGKQRPFLREAPTQGSADGEQEPRDADRHGAGVG